MGTSVSSVRPTMTPKQVATRLKVRATNGKSTTAVTLGRSSL